MSGLFWSQFHNNWAKIVNFSLTTDFWAILIFESFSIKIHIVFLKGTLEIGLYFWKMLFFKLFHINIHFLKKKKLTRLSRLHQRHNFKNDICLGVKRPPSVETPDPRSLPHHQTHHHVNGWAFADLVNRKPFIP